MSNLVEVSKRTFEKIVDCYCRELYISSRNTFDGRLLTFIDRPKDNPEPLIVAEELLDMAGNSVQFKVEQSLL